MDNNEFKDKILYILRGPVGIGKSTYIKDKGFKVLSTDEFFYDDEGNYNFNRDFLPAAHLWNYVRSLRFFSNEVPEFCIDNTNIELWEMKDYVIAAKEFGYKISIIEFDIPDELTALDLCKRSKHNVPLNTVKKMISNYSNSRNATIEQILNSKKPEDK